MVKIYGLVLTDKIEIDIIELKKVQKEYNKNRKDKKSQWMMFMNNPEDEEVDKIMEENEGIKEAKIEVVKMSHDEKIRKLAELREKAIRDEKSCYNTGLHEGMKEGEKKATIKIAKQLLKKGMKVDEIAQITSLSINEIEKLKQ